MIICICGKSCSGKSSITNYLKTLNNKIVYLDIDKIGHKSLQDLEIKRNLVKSFGTNILTNNEVDRKKLGKLVFDNKSNMKILADITLKVMEKDIDDYIKENKNKIILLDWICLSETKYFGVAKLKILVDASYEIRLERAIKRDNITKEEFDLRDSSSIDYNLNSFDYIIENNEQKNTERMVRRIYDKNIVSR